MAPKTLLEWSEYIKVLNVEELQASQWWLNTYMEGKLQEGYSQGDVEKIIQLHIEQAIALGITLPALSGGT